MISRALILIGFCLITTPSWAFLTLDDTGDILKKDHYRIGVEPQLKFSNGSGGNVGFFLDGSVNDEWGYRAEIGTGNTNFWAGGSAKWIPIPDYAKQPAIGLRGDVLFGRTDGDGFTVFRITPLISKGFDTDHGRFTPYAGVPVGIMATNGTSNSFTQFIIGSQAQLIRTEGFSFSGELGFNMNKAFSYIAGFVAYDFDDTGFKRK